MHLAVRANRLRQALARDLGVNDHGEARPQIVASAQAVPKTGVDVVEFRDDLAHLRPGHGNSFLTAREVTQQGWNPNPSHAVCRSQLLLRQDGLQDATG
jgi:hypothetical protein